MLKSLLTKALLLLPFVVSYVNAEPLVWQAKDDQRQFIFLGSIHAGNTDLYPLPTIFLQHWQHADALVVEANILQPSRARLDPEVPSTESVLSKTEKQALTATAKLAGLSPSSLLQSPPWLSAITLQMHMARQAKLDPEQGIDITLLRRAKAQQLPILELESITQQIHLMEQLPDHGKDLLMTTVTGWGEMETQLTCLLTAWKAGDQQQLLTLFHDSQYSSHTDDALINNRNHNWAKQLTTAPEYQQGTFMVVVGAMHLLGKQGVQALLAQQGFDVKPLTQGQTVRCD
ncbi:TraB/GumN family protein [Photobacterium nomapromontoriensis]|uniref:TraB/GumN family protein n=1 Tax=Photobacterium nomapromontoriensis TaxID=2910237 RepID=UPI003D0D167C